MAGIATQALQACGRLRRLPARLQGSASQIPCVSKDCRVIPGRTGLTRLRQMCALHRARMAAKFGDMLAALIGDADVINAIPADP